MAYPEDGVEPGKGALGSENREDGGVSDTFEGAGHGAAAAPGAPAQRKGRRRKRRRGKKVFARDTTVGNDAIGHATSSSANSREPATSGLTASEPGKRDRGATIAVSPDAVAGEKAPISGGNHAAGGHSTMHAAGNLGDDRRNGNTSMRHQNSMSGTVDRGSARFLETDSDRSRVDGRSVEAFATIATDGAALSPVSQRSARGDGGGGDSQEARADSQGAASQRRPQPQPRDEPRRLRAFPYRREPRPGDLPAYAALDLGTNNCRLLVAVPGRPGQFKVIDAFSRIVRLGEGLSATGRLSEAAMERAIEALRVCADKLGVREVRRARLIATEACRAAENGEEFLERVKEATGLTLEIIDRETEARLAVSGCGPLVERDTDAVVLFDIGGGSSEIALVDLSRERSARLAKHIVAWTSLPVGVVSLAEKFGGRDVTRDIFATMVSHVGEMIERFEGRASLGALVESPRFHLLGTSGTVTTLAGVHLGLARYDRRQVDGLWMQRDHIDGMLDKMLGWDFDTRVANPCIGADRADLVLAGCAILEAIRRTWPAQRLRVADRGLREGILSELMARDGAWRRGRPRTQGERS